MLRSNLAISALSASIIALGTFAGSVGCGDSGGSGGSNGGSGGTGSGTHAEPPSRPSGAKAGDKSGPRAMGVTKLYLGSTTRAGAASPDAWKDFGYDLDGQVTGTTDFTKHCKPNSGGSPKNVFPDGTNGIDNSFGKNLLPIIKAAAGSTDLQAEANSALATSFTIIVDMDDLGSSTDYDPVSAFLVGGKNGVVAGGKTTWELVPELLKSGGTSATDSTVAFPKSYLAGNTWVSGDKGTVDLNLSIAGFTLDLKIASALITMKMSGDHNSATDGVIAGVLKTEDFIAELKKVVGAIEPSLCSGGAVDSILNTIRQSSDIMSDGTQDPNSTCDGISIGIGFDAAAVELGKVGDPAAPQKDPCAAGGAGGGGGASGG